MAQKSQKSAQDKPAQAPISAHPLFGPLVALWFGTLFGLGSFVLPEGLFESVLGSPLGVGSRLLIALVAGAIGAALGFWATRKLTGSFGLTAGSDRTRSITQRGNRNKSTRAPLSIREEMDDHPLPDTASTMADLLSARRRSLTSTDDHTHDTPFQRAAEAEDADLPLPAAPAATAFPSEPVATAPLPSADSLQLTNPAPAPTPADADALTDAWARAKQHAMDQDRAIDPFARVAQDRQPVPAQEWVPSGERAPAPQPFVLHDPVAQSAMAEETPAVSPTPLTADQQAGAFGLDATRSFSVWSAPAASLRAPYLAATPVYVPHTAVDIPAAMPSAEEALPETLAAETLAAETPAAETPVVETPVVETLGAESAVWDEAAPVAEPATPEPSAYEPSPPVPDSPSVEARIAPDALPARKSATDTPKPVYGDQRLPLTERTPEQLSLVELVERLAHAMYTTRTPSQRAARRNAAPAFTPPPMTIRPPAPVWAPLPAAQQAPEPIAPPAFQSVPVPFPSDDLPVAPPPDAAPFHGAFRPLAATAHTPAAAESSPVEQPEEEPALPDDVSAQPAAISDMAEERRSRTEVTETTEQALRNALASLQRISGTA